MPAVCATAHDTNTTSPITAPVTATVTISDVPVVSAPGVSEAEPAETFWKMSLNCLFCDVLMLLVPASAARLRHTFHQVARRRLDDARIRRKLIKRDFLVTATEARGLPV